MNIGWKSPLDGRVYGLEDFDALSGVVPEPVLRAMTGKEKEDVRHSGANITITSGLGCPRKLLVQRMLPIAKDPTKMWVMQRGTWLHEMIGMRMGENEEWWAEETDTDKCEYSGKLFGVELSCRIDALKRDYSALIDWKFRKDFAERYVDAQGRAKPEDSAQVNMARILIEQTTGQDLGDMEMLVWVMAGEMKRTRAPWMSESDIGRVRPGGGKYSIMEIFGMINESMRGWKTMAENHAGDIYAVPEEQCRKLIDVLPMVGETMYQRRNQPSLNMCTQYCEVQEECYKCGGGL
jgi:hypothetical protein